MARSTHTQSNFQGGQFSPSAQGRLDLPQYRTALAQCVNAYPVEAGAVTRRPGTRLAGPTHRGLPGILATFALGQTNQYVVEMTVDSGVGIARYWLDGHIVMDTSQPNITAISTANPAVITVSSPQTWQTGEDIMILIDPAGVSDTNAAMWSQLVNRQIRITRNDSTHFALQDAITGANINGAGFTGALPTPIIAGHITFQTTNFNQAAELPFARMTQAESQLFVFGGSTGTFIRQPQSVQAVTGPAAGVDATFSWGYVNFIDGPYFNPITSDPSATISGTSGTVTFTVGSIVNINGGIGFQSTDVGRYVRIQVSPPIWASGTTYNATGSVVHYPGDFTGSDYTSIDSGVTNLGLQPDTNPAAWAPVANKTIWTYGTIVSINSTSSVQVGLVVALPATSPIIQYALSLFTSTSSQWPTVGTYYEGRIYLGGGAVGSVLITSVVGGVTAGQCVMSPTDTFGNVLDTSGIFYTILGQGQNTAQWMLPDPAGVIIGAATGEWIVQSSQISNGVITPTSVQIHQTTKYGSTFTDARRPGIALIFIDRFNNTLQEYLLDPFSQKYGARPLNYLAQNITGGLFQVEYQSVPNPMIWVRADNVLAGCLYRRVSYFASEMPTMYGWHTHNFGGGLVPTYLANAATTGGNTDQLYILGPNSIGGQPNFVHVLTPPFDDTFSLANAWFVDQGSTGVQLNSSPRRFEGLWGVEDVANLNMIISGLYYQAGQTVSVFMGALDLGDYVVSATGNITIPYAGTGTRAYFQSVSVAANTPGSIPVNMSGTVFWIPGCIGYTYTTTVETMRPDHQEDARTPNGPAAALRKRHYWYGLQVAAGVANSMQISGDPTDIFYPVTLDNDKTGLATLTNVKFQGTWRDTIESDYNLDGQITITVGRPVPMTLTQITGFMESEEI
jgi:hypothetical protein